MMERKVMQAREQAASLLKSSQQREIEADELRRELERAKVGERAKVVEHVTRQQLMMAGGGGGGGAVAQTPNPLPGTSNVRNGRVSSFDYHL